MCNETLIRYNYPKFELQQKLHVCNLHVCKLYVRPLHNRRCPKNRNGENKNLIFFKRNTDAQRKVDFSINFFVLFAFKDAYY